MESKDFRGDGGLSFRPEDFGISRLFPKARLDVPLPPQWFSSPAWTLEAKAGDHLFSQKALPTLWRTMLGTGNFPGVQLHGHRDFFSVSWRGLELRLQELLGSVISWH